MDDHIAIILPKKENVVIDISSDDDAAPARRAAAPARRANKLELRGPKIKGNDTYDSHCVFPNSVALNREQVKFLKRQVAMLKPTIPLYVCTIQTANIVDGSSKMYFTKKYTNAYIKKYLELPAEVPVYKWNKRCTTVRIVMGKGKGKGAQITSNWRHVVDRNVMEKGDVFMFWFRRSSETGLKLIVEDVM